MQSPIEETYEEVQRLMFFVCHKFQKRHGGLIDDLMSTANLTYMTAYEQWKPGGAPFHCYLSTSIYRRLMGEWRFNKRRIKTSSLGEYIPQQREEEESIVPDLVALVGEEAETVLQLIQETPADLWTAIEGKGGAPRNYRTCIREYLHDKGWTVNEVNDSFTEIEGALQLI